MQADVLNIEGKKTGRTVELPEEIFGIEPNDHVIYLAVKQYLAAQRQGTHKVKTRLEVFLFDFDEDIYGQVIETELIHFIRPELKFDSLEAMIERMHEDGAEARRWPGR